MARRIQYIGWFFVLFIQVSWLYAQPKYTLSGYIKDADNGETLIGANIYVKGQPQLGTSTNTFGYFSLSLDPGNYSIITSYLGFQDQENKINLNKDTKLNVALTQGVLLEELVIEENKALDQVQNTSMGRIEMKTEDIKRLPALLGEVDVLKALQLLPGVSASDEGGAGFYVRGGGADQNLLLLDEAPVYNSGHLLGFFSVFNSDAIKNTTLIKGNMPANYGGRISSVIDVQMKEGNNKHFVAEGGIGLVASRLTLQGPLAKEKTSFIVSARRTYVLDLIQPFIKGTNFEGTNYYFYDLNAKVNHTFSDKDRIYLSGYFGRDILTYKSAERGFGLSMPYGNNTATFRWNHVVNPKMFMNLTALYNGYDFQLTGSQDLFVFKLNNGVVDYQGKMDFDYFPNPGRVIKFGGSIIHHQFTPNIIQGQSGDVNFTNALQPKYGLESAAYLQDELKLSKTVTFNTGFRLSRFDQLQSKVETPKSYFAIEPRLFTTILINSLTSIKFGYNLNAQYIHLVSNSASTLPTDVWVPSSEIVQPQRGHQLSLGWFKTNKNNTWNYSVETFYKILKNQIDYRESYTNNQAGEVEESFVFGKGAAYGAELFIQKNKGRLTGWLGYTYLRSWREFPDIENGRRFPATFEKPHDIELILNYDINKRWNVGSNLVYSTGRPFTPLRSVYYINNELINRYGPRNSSRYQDYHRMDITATYTPNPGSNRKFKSTWSFSVYNAYNRKNPFFLSYDLDADLSKGRVSASAYKVSLFPLIPSITWNFKIN